MDSKITFGPEGDQWHYERSTKTYDLTREAGSKKFTISTTKGRPDTAVAVNPALTALVIVDMQNFFLDAKCRNHPTGLAAVEPTLAVIEKCRDVGVQVVWLNWGLTDQDITNMPAGVTRCFSKGYNAVDGTSADRSGLGSDLGDGQGRMLMAGEWNSEIYAPLAAVVRPTDVHCAKNRMSGMWSEEQPVWKYLEESRKKTLLFAGVNTDQCVLGTLTDAHNAGWDCIMIDDCCATSTKNGHDVCVRNVSGAYGFVVDSKAVSSGTLA